MEAYHAGSIREQLIQNGSYVVQPYNVTVDTIVDVSVEGRPRYVLLLAVLKCAAFVVSSMALTCPHFAGSLVANKLLSVCRPRSAPSDWPLPS